MLASMESLVCEGTRALDPDGRWISNRGSAREHNRTRKRKTKEWRYSAEVLLPHRGEKREAPQAGEIFRQPDLAATLRKLVQAEQRRSLPAKTERTLSTQRTIVFTEAT